MKKLKEAEKLDNYNSALEFAINNKDLFSYDYSKDLQDNDITPLEVNDIIDLMINDIKQKERK